MGRLVPILAVAGYLAGTMLGSVSFCAPEQISALNVMRITLIAGPLGALSAAVIGTAASRLLAPREPL